MNKRNQAALTLSMTLLSSLVLTSIGRADMDEAWLHRAPLPEGTNPLLGIILDRSTATARSMSVDEPYDPLRDYGVGLPTDFRCDPAKAYWRRGAGHAPDCGQQAGLDIAPRNPASGLQCDAARAALATQGYFVASRAAQWHAGTREGNWSAPRPESTAAIECRADRGRHGAAPGNWFATDGTGTPWTDAATREIAWDRSPFADPYIFYAGNFLNYLRGARATVERTLAELMSSQLSQALAATRDLEVALILVDDDGPEGGYVAHAPSANGLVAATVQQLSDTAPAGSAPLGETLAETANWLQGGPKRFGVDQRADPAAAKPLAPDQYLSPFTHACRPISLGFLTAGEASEDELAAPAAVGLPRFEELTGGCGTSCLGPLSQWLAATDLREDLPGTQSAPMSWIAPSPAAVGGDAAPLADPLAYVNLVARAFQHDAAIAADPQVSAAGLTPLVSGTGEPGVILGITAPVARERWPGNLLRYALRAPAGPLLPPLLIDRDGQAAIDGASGLPLPSTRSLWSDAPDSNLLAGGAAGKLPSAQERRVHTDIASDRLLHAANRLEPGNPYIVRSVVGLSPTDPDTLDDVLSWAATQRTLGDPGPHAPIIVEYPQSSLQVAYITTHDGMLQAFDATSGIELWAWMPKEMLPRIPALMRNEVTTARSHGIDGPIVPHRHDADGNGLIAAELGEHMWLVFGLGRGGNRYYALDISAPTDPRLLWSIALPDTDVENRSEPVITRLAIDGSGQSTGDWVILLAAGNSLHVVDALTAEILWSAGANGPELAIAEFANLASAPRALDLDGDGYLDRSYVLDVTGGLWRFDFASGQSGGELATASRLARLGTGAHRFHASPDVSISRIGNKNRISIAAGSGRTSRPREATIEERLYVIFDPEVAVGPREISEANLYDATDTPDTMPPDAPGWFVRLDAHGPGEKVVGSAVTFDHVLRFRTYQPLAIDEPAPCGPPRSVSRLYALDVRTALPRATAVESEDEGPEEMPASGLPVGAQFGFPGSWEGACEGCRPRPFGIIGGETFDPGYAGDPVRTSWRKLTPPPVSP